MSFCNASLGLIAASKEGEKVMKRTVFCIKLKKQAPGLSFPPLPNALGQKIYENISQEAWDQWVQYQTKIINEGRLNLSDPSARAYLSQQMEYFLFSD